MQKHSFLLIVWRTTVRLLVDARSVVSLGFRSRSQLAAENLFLRKQLALYRERQVKPRRADDVARIALVALSRLIDWRAVLTIVNPSALYGSSRFDCCAPQKSVRAHDSDQRRPFRLSQLVCRDMGQ